MVTKTLPIAEEIAFDDYLRYGSDDEASKGTTTRKAYLWTVDLFQRFLNGRQPTPDLARGFLKELEEKGNSASSINRHIWALKSYFRFQTQLVEGLARQEGLTPGTSEWATFLGKEGIQELKIRGLKTNKYYPRYLRDKEWDKLLQTAANTIYDPEVSTYARNRARLELALLYAYGGAGLRLSEAVNMAIEDVIDEGFLRVMRKGGREDFVPVEDEVLRGIKDYIETKGVNGRYVFPGLKPDTPMAACGELLEAAYRLA